MKLKIVGYLLIAISILMFLALLTQFKEIQNTLSLISRNPSSREKGQFVGALLYYVIHMFLMIFLFIKGRKKLKQ